MNVYSLRLWLPRLILTLVTILFATISFRFAVDPVGAAIPFGLAPTSSLGITTLRVSMGAFPATLSVISLYCLIRSRLMAGLSIVSLVMGTILGMRFYSGLMGGIMAEQSFIIFAEGAFLVLSLLSLLLLRKRPVASV